MAVSRRRMDSDAWILDYGFRNIELKEVAAFSDSENHSNGKLLSKTRSTRHDYTFGITHPLHRHVS